ncbi:DUF3054 domain-containing protein [Specibacter sp. NPDC057265]|uniref:DUF3054 domain-containing protein n=1 Tax=Specibacter sp. NPDC057265 TaxID=3346075 RepID=UPI0036281A04
MTEKKSRTVLYTLAADTVLVAAFALAGRDTHGGSLTAAGLWETAWPFLGALAAAWLLCRAWRSPLRLWPTGVCLWLITVSGGMVLRLVSNHTAAWPFVIVAFLVLGLFLLGHRLVAARIARGKRPEPSPAARLRSK